MAIPPGTHHHRNCPGIPKERTHFELTGPRLTAFGKVLSVAVAAAGQLAHLCRSLLQAGNSFI